MRIRTLIAVAGLLSALALCACGGDDGATLDMSHCAPTTCSSSQVFNAKTCSCDNLDMSSHD